MQVANFFQTKVTLTEVMPLLIMRYNIIKNSNNGDTAINDVRDDNNGYSDTVCLMEVA